MGYTKTIFRQAPELPSSRPPPKPFSESALRGFKRYQRLTTTFAVLGGCLVLYTVTRDKDEYFDTLKHREALKYREANLPVPKDLEERMAKKVLVLPFHRMKLVEKKKNTFKSLLSRSELLEGDDAPFEVEVSDLVQVIHAAALDPGISALYGTFGHGFKFHSGGWAHIEEVRNALKVWRESHRIHREPNLTHNPEQLVVTSDGDPKPSYAFADTFTDPDDKGNKEYLVACAFSNVHMQKNGSLNLFGVASSTPFFRSFMEKYGIKAHVFKHGKYKNAPNTFTHKGYTHEHRHNVQNMVDQIDLNKRDGIVEGRDTKGFDPMVWKMIRKHGSFTGEQALKLGLVDHLPKLCPLGDLLKSNFDDNKAAMIAKWGDDTDMKKFNARGQVSFQQYLSFLATHKRVPPPSIFDFLVDNPDEKIAVVYVTGNIDDVVASTTVASLRKIKKDSTVKAVVLRVDSGGGSAIAAESILQECKDMPQPVICSMGNYCASGGYYIATGCKRIFALPTTITGSIGVFAVKFDLTGLAKKYGISVQHITTGPYSASYHPFQPLNPLVKSNFTREVDRMYDYFKSIVSESRGLDLKEVETLAQGKIWTGGEAKENGLIDELGGLERAISYARRVYTKGGGTVERWPKSEGWFTALTRIIFSGDAGATQKVAAMLRVLSEDISYPMESQNANEYDSAKFLIQSVIEDPTRAEFMRLGGISLTMDENAAMTHLITENSAQLHRPLLHSSFWN